MSGHKVEQNPSNTDTDRLSPDELWIEELDEVMFQPTEIVPNTSRVQLSPSEMEKAISARLDKSSP
ncbi:hypothetical protein [Dinoroseobacter sp. S375]|uniref:hypothetical protein n=1 Tax=Dinoroseobacter sp. S375 TaxID=3415136 RepID=UPI003C7B09DF